MKEIEKKALNDVLRTIILIYIVGSFSGRCTRFTNSSHNKTNFFSHDYTPQTLLSLLYQI